MKRPPGGATRPVRRRRDQDGRASRQELASLLADVLAYARERDYTGWDYADGASSRLLRALPVRNRWLELAFQETVKRAPVNLRPLFLVEQRRNFMGAGLFAMANVTMARHAEAADSAPDGRDHALAGRGRTSVDLDAADYEREARSLLDWLVDARLPGYSGFCGGHRHVVVGLSGRGEPSEADAVSTAFPVRALLRGGRLDDRYPAIARTAADFVVEDLDYCEVDTGARVDYYEGHPDDSYTINAGAIAARLLLDVYDHVGDEALRERATKLLDHVVSLQTDRGGWYYREPPGASHLSMDNHHNGFVIACLQRHHEVVATDRYEASLSRALSFYRDELFDDDGAPSFDEASAFPRDVHACANGIIVFSYAGEFEFANRVLEWTLENLYAGDGRFYFREQRHYTKRITLMRWCQAWMAYAIGELLARQYPAGRATGTA